MTREYLKKQGWEQAETSTKFISSPHLRTIQTAAAFQYEWTQDANTEILTNETIVVGEDDWTASNG